MGWPETACLDFVDPATDGHVIRDPRMIAHILDLLDAYFIHVTEHFQPTPKGILALTPVLLASSVLFPGRRRRQSKAIALEICP
jgi:hypothetical protein